MNAYTMASQLSIQPLARMERGKPLVDDFYYDNNNPHVDDDDDDEEDNRSKDTDATPIISNIHRMDTLQVANGRMKQQHQNQRQPATTADKQRCSHLHWSLCCAALFLSFLPWNIMSLNAMT